jgi:EmrB/QacA subfamily drug resistance transporter
MRSPFLSPPLPQSSPHYKWLVMGVVALGTLMATIDSSVVNIALPVISQQFHARITATVWVTLSYLLTVTVLLLIFGRLGDLLGRQRVYGGGFLAFTVGSALCGLSGSLGQLILFRAVQAVGAAMMFANGGALITAAFPASERGRALGINGSVVSTGLTLGPSLGGFLLDWAGWRSIFYINLPIGLVGMLAVRFLLHPEEVGREHRRFDFPGAFLLGGGLLAFTLALTQGRQFGWDSPWVDGGLVLAGLCLGAFILQERRTAHPMIDLTLFRNRLFTAANVAGFLNFVAGFSNVLLMPFYLQQLKGFSPSQAGLMMTAVPLTTLFVAPVSGWLSDRFGSVGLSSTGLFINAVGFLWLSRLDGTVSPADVTWRLILVGVGNGLFQSPNNSAIMGAVPRPRLGVASGFIALVRNLGMVTGLAIAGAVFESRQAALQGQGLAGPLAFLGAFRTTYWMAAAILLVAMGVSLVRGPQGEPAVPGSLRGDGESDAGAAP